MVDLVIQHTDASAWRLWVWEGRPLRQLSWDPGEFRWPSSSKDEVSFFEYSASIGRHILIQQVTVQPTMTRVWEHAGLTDRFLCTF